jgi:hypothetical protein
MTVKVYDSHLSPPLLCRAQGRQCRRVIATEGEDPRPRRPRHVGASTARDYPVRLVQLLERVRVVQPDERHVAAVCYRGPGLERVLAYREGRDNRSAMRR